ncbi:hypothetical protein [Geotoga petraea]|jgi:hypothetical protein|uniref:LTXXQ motif family protein n=1 Tax=Geotoga petraea TaxID=28234 RepID=A0A4Z0W5Q4_9BACT|nr:hypothetical protein [Geotoga petraea]MDK2946066.1 hypothetical protein [Geotoga sp.]TGG88752.1 hypothetical protein E4650_00690 [Geotoga petraea]
MKKILLVAVIGLLSLSIFAFGGNGYNTKANPDTRGGYYQEDNFNQLQNGYNNRMPENRNQMPMNRRMPIQRNMGSFDNGFRNAGENTMVTLELLIDKYSPELAKDFNSLQEEILQLREEQQTQLRTRDFSNDDPIQIRDRINNSLELRGMYSELMSEYQQNDEEEIKEILERIVNTMRETIDNFETEEIE